MNPFGTSSPNPFEAQDTRSSAEQLVQELESVLEKIQNAGIDIVVATGADESLQLLSVYAYTSNNTIYFDVGEDE